MSARGGEKRTEDEARPATGWRPRRLWCVPAAMLASAVCGADDLQIIPELRFSYLSGYTLYQIEGSYLDPTTFREGSWRSRLTFPINNLRLDGTLGARVWDRIELSLGGWSTLDESAGTLQDDDYLNDVRDVWSRSNADLGAWGIEGKATFWAVDEEEFLFGPTIEASYDRFDYDVYNVRQFAIDPRDVAYADGKVLEYRQERLSFPLGVALRWMPLRWWELEWSAAVSAFTYVWDEDDHVLRYKVSEANAFAFMVKSGLTLDFVLWDAVRLGAWSEVLYLQSWWGEQDQYFYGGRDRGTRFEDIEYEIRRLSYLVGARLSVEF